VEGAAVTQTFAAGPTKPGTANVYSKKRKADYFTYAIVYHQKPMSVNVSLFASLNIDSSSVQIPMNKLIQNKIFEYFMLIFATRLICNARCIVWPDVCLFLLRPIFSIFRGLRDCAL